MGLTLTRSVGQAIVIGDGLIVVRVVRTMSKGRITLDVTAPKELSVHREEIYYEILRERARTKGSLHVEEGQEGAGGGAGEETPL